MDSVHIPELHLVRLTNPEKEALHLAMRAGDATARDRLIRSGLPFANDLALRYARRHERRLTTDVVDAYVSAARLGLIEAVDRWDPARSKLLNYVMWWVRAHVQREAKARRAAREAPEDLWDVADASDPPDAAALRLDAREAASVALEGIRAMDGRHALWRETLLHYHGLDGREALDQPDLAARQGVSRAAVSKRYGRALNHLRQYLESRGITDAHL